MLFWDNFSALFDQKLDYIPLTFMLGFFVTIIVGRWKEYFNNIGWVDNTALVISTYLRGNDEKSRMMRRNVLRYMVLTQVRRRLPTLDTVVAAGFMTEAERDKYTIYLNKLTEINCTPHFLPIQWCYTILFEARTSGKLSCDLMLNEIVKVGLTIVDECYGELPLQQKDSFWGAEAIEPLYSAESAVKSVNPQIGSAANYEVEQDEVLMMPHIAGEDFDNLSFDDPEARSIAHYSSTKVTDT
ncbi:Bestrophin [Ancylostoma duodenale]|uniref:Bestrophin homolog n=1 Tax=Ancylostoma duodenale TaxID=51022 RepID=A0A0C2G3M2_9BILA|nr:Bestrophin [Ancylostoma duodenale]